MSLYDRIVEEQLMSEGSGGQAKLRRKRRASSKQMTGRAGGKDWESYWALKHRGRYQGPAGGKTPTSTASRATKDGSDTSIGSPLYTKHQGQISRWRQRTDRHQDAHGRRDPTHGREFKGHGQTGFGDSRGAADARDDADREKFAARKASHAAQRGHKTRGRKEGDVKVIFGRRFIFKGGKWVKKTQ